MATVWGSHLLSGHGSGAWETVPVNNSVSEGQRMGPLVCLYDLLACIEGQRLFRSGTQWYYTFLLFFCMFLVVLWFFCVCEKLKYQQIFTDFWGIANQLYTSSSAFLTHAGQRYLHTWNGTRAHGHGCLPGNRGQGRPEVLTLLGVDVRWDVRGVWSWRKVLITVSDEGGERVDGVRRLHHRDFIWLQSNHRVSR